ncbi:MAG: acyl-CoA thioesterase [Rhodobacteraceae bacterium]|nr:acyl-CoA thioesterase [Paracoccaceae bacterium]
MYPVFRMAKEIFVHRNAPPMGVNDVHVSRHICWPWDLDYWMELNNGRTLTLYDLGRIPMAKRLGLISALKENDWRLSVAGASVRYRRRVHVFDRLEIRSRVMGWDHRFFYLEQSMWKAGEATGNALYRSAASGPDGIVDPALVATAMGLDPVSPPLPKWTEEWISAESHRPWPPQK